MDGRGAATHEASRCGAALVPVLLEIIVGKNEYGHPWDGKSRRGAVIALGLMGAQGATARHVLASVLVDSKDALQADAAVALKSIGAAAADTVPALVAALRTSDDHQVCTEVAVSLAVLGGADAVAPLVDALRSERLCASLAAALALGSLGRGAQAAVPALTLLLEHPHPSVRARAASALQQIRRAVR